MEKNDFILVFSFTKQIKYINYFCGWKQECYEAVKENNTILSLYQLISKWSHLPN